MIIKIDDNYNKINICNNCSEYKKELFILKNFE